MLILTADSVRRSHQAQHLRKETIALIAGSDSISIVGQLEESSVFSVSGCVGTVSQGEALLTMYVEQSTIGDAWWIAAQVNEVIQPGRPLLWILPLVGPERTRLRMTIGQGTATVSVTTYALPVDIKPAVFRLGSSNMLRRVEVPHG